MLVGHVELPVAEIAAICRKYKVKELAVFGSALRDDFREESDVDLLVDFLPNHGVGLVEYISCQMDLSATIGRKVDLVDKRGLKKYVRDEVLGTTRVIYAA